MIPLVILDLSPKFNTSALIYDTYTQRLEEKLNQKLNKIYIYNSAVFKKLSVEEDEHCYNSILRACNKVKQRTIFNKNGYYDSIIVHLGRFAEYRYLFNMLRYETPIYHRVHRIYCRHPSYYIKDTCEKKREESFNKDVKKITTCLTEARANYPEKVNHECAQ